LVADAGCGTGRASIRLAQVSPRSRVQGFDIHGSAIQRAERSAREEGVEDRVSFPQLDIFRTDWPADAGSRESGPTPPTPSCRTSQSADMVSHVGDCITVIPASHFGAEMC